MSTINYQRNPRVVIIAEQQRTRSERQTQQTDRDSERMGIGRFICTIAVMFKGMLYFI